jgi:hypothetical protein
MKKNIFIFVVFALLLCPALSKAEKSCIWMKDENYCPVEKVYMWPRENCINTTQYGLCCCAESPDSSTNKTISSIKPKYIIIGSLVIVFGIITTYFLVVKNNESS